MQQSVSTSIRMISRCRILITTCCCCIATTIPSDSVVQQLDRHVQWCRAVERKCGRCGCDSRCHYSEECLHVIAAVSRTRKWPRYLLLRVLLLFLCIRQDCNHASSILAIFRTGLSQQIVHRVATGIRTDSAWRRIFLLGQTKRVGLFRVELLLLLVVVVVAVAVVRLR